MGARKEMLGSVETAVTSFPQKGIVMCVMALFSMEYFKFLFIYRLHLYYPTFLAQ